MQLNVLNDLAEAMKALDGKKDPDIGVMMVHEDEDGQQEEKSYGEDVTWAPCAAPPAQGV